MIDWLAVAFEVGRSFVWELLFPSPLNDYQYLPPPPVQIPKPSGKIFPEGGQCPTNYRLKYKKEKYVRYGNNPESLYSSFASSITFSGGLKFLESNLIIDASGMHRLDINLYYQNTSAYVTHMSPSAAVGSYTNVSVESTGDSFTLKWYVPFQNGYWREKFIFEGIERIDGLPDDCGDYSIPDGQGETALPIPRPAPLPTPLPIPIPIPKPLPVPLPPKPLPPSTPKPPSTPTPPPNIDIDIDINFDLSTTNNTININCNNGSGTIPLAPFQALAKILYAIWNEVRENREILDRLSTQIDCIHEKICNESKRFYSVNFGEVGYAKNSLYPVRIEGQSSLKPFAARILLPEISKAAGRRVRPRTLPLFSPQSLGYYALQFGNGSFGSLQEIRFRYQHIPLSSEVTGIVVYLEPQAGVGNLYVDFYEVVYGASS